MDSLETLINQRLIRYYGREPITRKAKYRVVRSETQTEKRYGTFDLLTQETGIWLGVKQGLVEIKKYWYLKPCWVLERCEPNTSRQLIFADKFTYEPLYTFLDSKDEELPLNWRVLEFMLSRLERAEKFFKSDEDFRKEEEKKQRAEEDKVFAILDAPDPIKELPTFKSSTLIPKR